MILVDVIISYLIKKEIVFFLIIYYNILFLKLWNCKIWYSFF